MESTPADSNKSPTVDDLDKDQLDQLHAATLKASDSCFELKKTCATVLVPTGTLVALLSDRMLNAAVFVTSIAMIFVFWMADSVAFFYQRRLRNAMANIWTRRADRCGGYEHIPEAKEIPLIRAPFNSSMVYYYLLLTLVVIAFVLYGVGAIGPVNGTTSP